MHILHKEFCKECKGSLQRAVTLRRAVTVRRFGNVLCFARFCGVQRKALRFFFAKGPSSFIHATYLPSMSLGRFVPVCIPASGIWESIDGFTKEFALDISWN